LTFSFILDPSIANTLTKYVLTDSAIANPSAGPFSEEPTKEIVADGFFAYGHQECLKRCNNSHLSFLIDLDFFGAKTSN
jgi:hypothetical protein